LKRKHTWAELYAVRIELYQDKLRILPQFQNFDGDTCITASWKSHVPIGPAKDCSCATSSAPQSRHLTHSNINTLLQPAHLTYLSNDMKSRQLRTSLRKAGKETGRCLQKVAWNTCKCVLYAVCAPCLCCALLCLPRRGGVRGGRATSYVRPDFPTPRPRALSLPLIEAQPNQRTIDQPHSDFMTKLPLELRRMVYAETLGGVTIHLMTCNGKPSAKQCLLGGVCQCDYFDPLQEKKLSVGLALLRTCRVM
jgi:hypothetical protein